MLKLCETMYTDNLLIFFMNLFLICSVLVDLFHLHIIIIIQAIEQLNLKTKNFKDLLTDEPFTRNDIITIQVKFVTYIFIFI